ncbi:MAG: site-2 protease family protein [Planctomycetota bacterium]|nr:MAG: site-2 protease family protein [Planctomycetota bacterium]
MQIHYPIITFPDNFKCFGYKSETLFLFLSKIVTDKQIFLVVTFGIFFFSMILHELAHGFTAFWLGDKTAKKEGRLSLNPLVHIDPLSTLVMPVLTYFFLGFFLGGAKPIPVEPQKLSWGKVGDFLVTIMGPLVHLLLACLLALSLHWIDSESLWAWILAFSFQIQVFLLLFNLLPIPPLDGFFVLRLLLPSKWAKFWDRYILPFGTVILICVLLLLFYTHTFVYVEKGVDSLMNLFAKGMGTAEQLEYILDYNSLREALGFDG